MEAKFFRLLRIAGIGYKARTESEGRLLYLKIGYSYEVELTVPPAARVFCFKPNAGQIVQKLVCKRNPRDSPRVGQVLCVIGIDKQRVHQFSGDVRSLKPPHIYSGRGISYMDEVIKVK